MIKRGQRGFTLIEILIILAVLGVLAAVVVPNVAGFLSRGKKSSYDADLATIQAAVDSYYSDPENVKFQGKRQYPIWAADAASATTAFTTSCATTADQDTAPADGNNPDRATAGGTPNWNDNNTDGKRDAGEKWHCARVTRGTTAYDYSTGGYIIKVQGLLDKGFLKSAPKSASADNISTGTGSYIWFVKSDGKVDSLYYYLPYDGTTAKTGFQTDVYP